MQRYSETICAPVHKPGSAITIIRISGNRAIEIADSVFISSGGKKLKELSGYSLVHGEILSGGEFIDEVLLSVFRAPRSYTGEDMAEVACHGSWYIQSTIIRLLIEAGASPAYPGEFTRRAFINGKVDLMQAEAIADLISSEAEIAHRLAATQMKGGYSREISSLRDSLLELTSLLELELDFGEEDVEFADRDKLLSLTNKIESFSSSLASTFSAGNAIRKGIPVAIAGRPNVGKSTILNGVINEERAIVSEIPGTTRDIIEDTFIIDGVLYRFIDTAGIRATDDRLESIGIKKALEKISGASVVLFVTEAFLGTDIITGEVEDFRREILTGTSSLIVVVNKSDLAPAGHLEIIGRDLEKLSDTSFVFMSAKESGDFNELKKAITRITGSISGTEGDIIITNSRHYEALRKVSEAASRIAFGLNDRLPPDLIAVEIRQAIHYLGEITGEITTDEVLTNIFRNFCIGK